MGLFSKKRTQPEIDLREPEPTGPAPFIFGYPTRCPACSSGGFLDHIDPFKKVQYEHCPVCLTKWELAEEEILALNR